MIETEQLCKHFGRVQAVQDVSLTVEQGTVTGLLGENGSGKSTLLKLLAGVQFPTRGKAAIDGQPVGPETKAFVSYAPETNPFYGWMRVIDVMRFQATFFDDFSWEQNRKLLESMALAPHQRVGHLSKGMQARLKLAAVLSREAKLYFLDEPISGIDPLSKRKILETMLERFRHLSATVIVSTHDVTQAEPLFDHVVFLREGSVALQGSAEGLRERYQCSLEDLFGRV